MSATIEKARELLGTRLGELNEEEARVKRAIEALGSMNGRRPAPTRKRRASTSAPRKRRTGTRRDQVLEIVETSDGIKGGEIAKKLKMKPNYLYRVLSDLVKEGRLRKVGKEYHPGRLTLSG